MALMNSNADSVPVRDNPAESRFEAQVGDDLAIAQYVRRPGQIAFTHTVVPTALEGRGIGSRLVRAALDHAKAEGLAVVPSCQFVAAYIRRHPEYQTLVAQD